ncbi:phosphotransferase enzyme family protein [Streptomyces katsurahamanus]|uniref:Aminoglycoside phosphotransferase family protein n=1 Tax=Streptomyces katsurahamanus TaxID=2577098 RepID=A0ABW9NWI2_9ACTN|nr:aminoglycoside phosphotransferase family protein [Streptomyces katsurahamanus]MQS37496.1 aminoglycoside phosphotransferase family protein [Streptomyces katsurahamanus]
MMWGDGETQGQAPEFTAETVGTVLREACRGAGLDPSGAVMLRLGSNAVFRLDASPVIVRIARDADALCEMGRAVRVARWLAAEGFPATRLLPGVPQPATVAGRAVTFWESAQDREEYASPSELAELLRRLHRLEEPGSLGLDCFDPFAKVWGSLGELRGLIEDDHLGFLEERADRLHQRYDRLDWVLPFGMIHGDANIGNALRDRKGRPLLIDLDGFALAQREWDLVLTALYYERLGWHTRAEYESFVHHYGFDLMNWPGYPVLADARELMMTLWLGQRVPTDPTSAEEFSRRVQTLRTNGSRRGWKPF